MAPEATPSNEHLRFLGAGDVDGCPACGAPARPDARFCSACGSPLPSSRSGAAVAEERRIVATLFCDLVGYTAMCEDADPEDVDRLLREFFALSRSVIEQHGGAVEKFIGDAVVGVFGVPLVHEDDSERAVLAALRIRDRMAGITPIPGHPLRVRYGVNTGVSLVRLKVRPDSGVGFLVGDTVNTAARLQQAAAPDAIVVGETTRRLTSRRFVYDRGGDVRLKGKEAAQTLWVLRGRISRPPAVLHETFPAPLVDRVSELEALRRALATAVGKRRPQYVLLVGEAGIGKSRIVAEFARWLDAQPDVTARWRQGACLPYGADVSHWAFGEIVKSHAGVLESDSAEAAAAKLRTALDEMPEREHLLERLRPLLGLPSPPAANDVNYAAWRRFIESLAGPSPLVLVFEDLHWADEGTLDFLASVARETRDVPLLIIGTARPELLDAHPEGDQAGHEVRILRVSALNGRQSAQLVSHLVAASPSSQLETFVSDRCGGNALYTQELVRLLQERSLVRRAGAGVSLLEGAEASVPDSLQTLIAARLDALDPAYKAVLADAAVVGRTFWPGAVAAVSDAPRDEVISALGELVAHEFVRARHDSTLADEQEYTFWHALTHEVAYGQLTRRARCVKHASAARWIEQEISADDAGDVAEILAHHYLTALDLARALQDAALADDLRASAVRALRLAGSRAMALDVRLAVRHYDTAIALLALDSAERPTLLAEGAEALIEAGRFEDAIAALDEAAPRLAAAGDRELAQAAAGRRWYSKWLLGHSDEEDYVVLEALEPTVAHIRAHEDEAGRAVHSGRNTQALAAADKALEICRSLDLPASPTALCYRGFARCALGDGEGLRDMRTAMKLAAESGSGHEQCAAASNLGECLMLFEGTGQALAVHRDALEIARQRHDGLAECFCREVLLVDHVWSGRWDIALDEADEVIDLLERNSDKWDLLVSRSTIAHLLAWSGKVGAAEAHAEWAEEHSRSSPLLSARQACLISLATVREAQRRDAEALHALRECARVAEKGHGMDAALRMPEAIRVAMRLGQPALARRLARVLPTSRPYDEATLELLRGLLLERRGEQPVAAPRLAAAAEIWTRLDVPHERAQTMLAQGRCLAYDGRTNAALGVLGAARDAFAKLGAEPATAQTETLIRSLG